MARHTKSEQMDFDGASSRIQQALQRVHHPVYRFLIVELVDNLTLHIAGIEKSLRDQDAKFIGGSKLSDTQ
jgi:hypothetical protein